MPNFTFLHPDSDGVATFVFSAAFRQCDSAVNIIVCTGECWQIPSLATGNKCIFSATDQPSPQEIDLSIVVLIRFAVC